MPVSISSSCNGDTATAAGRRQLPGFADDAVHALAEVEADRQRELVRGRPEALPRVLERGLVAHEQVEDGAAVPELGAPRELHARRLGRVRRQQREHDEAVGAHRVECSAAQSLYARMHAGAHLEVGDRGSPAAARRRRGSRCRRGPCRRGGRADGPGGSRGRCCRPGPCPCARSARGCCRPATTWRPSGPSTTCGTCSCMAPGTRAVNRSGGSTLRSMWSSAEMICSVGTRAFYQASV